MTSISGAAALSLFGVKADAQRMAALAAAAKAAEVAKAEVSKVAATKAASGSAVAPGDGKWRDPYAEYQAESARKFAESLALEAIEDKFEAENGFRRKVTSSLIASYGRALAGQGGGSFGSWQEASEWTVGHAHMAVWNIKEAEWAFSSLTPEVLEERTARYGEAEARRFHAERLDHAKYNLMMGFYTMRFVTDSKSIETSRDPLYNENGAWKVRSADFKFQGKMLFSIDDSGNFTKYDQAGNAHELR